MVILQMALALLRRCVKFERFDIWFDVKDSSCKELEIFEVLCAFSSFLADECERTVKVLLNFIEP